MDIGTTLRTARERQHLTLDQLARRTKIPVAQLKALEENAFGRLPRGIFARGFLRAYAAEVGLDGEALIEEFLEQTGGSPAGGPARPAAPGDTDSRHTPVLDSPQPGRALGGYLLLAAALAIGFAVYTRMTPPEATNPAQDAVAQHDSVPASPGEPVVEPTSGGAAPAADVVNARDVQPVATDGNQIRVEIAPQGPCWVEVRADGRLLVYRLMHAGERESFEVRREVSIRVGDPGAFAFSINGRAARPLGRAGVPAEARFTLDTWEQLVAGA